MNKTNEKIIYVIGCGAIGLPLAACLAKAGKQVLAVRTRRRDIEQKTVTVNIRQDNQRLSIPVTTVSLAKLSTLDGIIVITSKSYANSAIAGQLKEKSASGPLIIMQNGIGVEQPFVAEGFSNIYRCVLYLTSQAHSEYDFSISPVKPSPIGPDGGHQDDVQTWVNQLHTPDFPFCADISIQREVWKKTIANVAFNSICPLLDVDNGIFVRDEQVAQLALELVQECVILLKVLNIDLSEDELMNQILAISERSDGLYISTLQDIRSGRPTEIEYLNLEIARIAFQLPINLKLPKLEFLGKMIAAKSAQHMKHSSR